MSIETVATSNTSTPAKLDIVSASKALGKKAKYVLKRSDKDGLVDVGDVYEGEDGFYVVEGTDLVIGTNDEGKLLLKTKNPGTNPEITSKYVTLGRLFYNEKKKDGTPCKPHHSARAMSTIGNIVEGTRFVMFPNIPRTGKRPSGGFKRKVS